MELKAQEITDTNKKGNMYLKLCKVLYGKCIKGLGEGIMGVYLGCRGVRFL